MAVSNRDRVGKAMDLLQSALNPYVEREMQSIYGRGWWAKAQETFSQSRSQVVPPAQQGLLDVQALLVLMRDQWSGVFARKLGNFERNLVHELMDIRRKWAHQEAFSLDDAYRALDSVGRMLTAISAVDQAAEVDRERQELLRTRYEEQTRQATRRVAVAPVEGRPSAGLRPWREIVTPHPDVASGRYLQAEFAADLAQVARGEAGDEYQQPTEFFRRTYLTGGLNDLLIEALRRLGGSGGEPVLELQTNFGGGKTHAMLALYHLFSGAPVAELPGIEELLAGGEVPTPVHAQRAVLVGTALSPTQPRAKPDGTVVRTLWGEMAWQLGGADGYSLVADADRNGNCPGSDDLRELFELCAPCLVLIDEWVAYARNLYGIDGLPGGSFDGNTLNFAQALTEAAMAVPRTLVVASVPASDIEIGGEGGQKALEQLRNTVARVAAPWRPASAEESFEIVRRRLFQPIVDPELFPQRDAAVRAFATMYRTQSSEFPSGCGEASYERRLQSAYPIHPELFERLYSDWSSLDKFQRTRGVLTLMAAVIHTLWERQDPSLLILPGTVPIDSADVQSRLTRYLDDNWVPVIERDVDGPNSLPLQLDRDNPNLGRFSASRRVARSLFLGSAPVQRAANKGLEDRQVKLGCAQPGESVATFGDALRRLTDQATFLYVDGRRSWYATQPSVTRLAQDRAEQADEDTIWVELIQRLREEQNRRGDFTRVYPAPTSGADVPDEREARLVILRPDYAHTAKSTDSPALKQATVILDQRGGGPRRYRNTLVFLAADRARLADLEQAIRQFLAWRSIWEEREALNLDAFQMNQAQAKRDDADETVKRRIPEAFQWLLVPTQEPQGAMEWQELRLQGDDALAVRASKRLRNDGLLITQYGAVLLRLELDRIPLWRGEQVEVRQLVEDFAVYPYLPRLRDGEVLLRAIQDGVGTLTWESDTFAYAEAWDTERGRFLGLRAGQTISVALDDRSVLVQAEAARRQLDAEATARQDQGAAPSATDDDVGRGNGHPTPTTSQQGTNGEPPAPEPERLTRFHGSAQLDAIRTVRDAGQIADEVISHLLGLPGAKVTVTLEIEASVPDGAPKRVVDLLTINCQALRFLSSGFEVE